MKHTTGPSTQDKHLLEDKEYEEYRINWVQTTGTIVSFHFKSTATVHPIYTMILAPSTELIFFFFFQHDFFFFKYDNLYNSSQQKIRSKCNFIFWYARFKEKSAHDAENITDTKKT